MLLPIKEKEMLTRPQNNLYFLWKFHPGTNNFIEKFWYLQVWRMKYSGNYAFAIR